MSGERKVPGREDLSRVRVALIDKITEFANAGSWPEDKVLVAAVLTGLREGSEGGDRTAMALARRLPRRSVEGGGQFDVAEWIALLRRAEAMDAALAEQGSSGVVTEPGREAWVMVERLGVRLVDGMSRIAAWDPVPDRATFDRLVHSDPDGPRKGRERRAREGNDR